jgi:hypothetical protein
MPLMSGANLKVFLLLGPYQVPLERARASWGLLRAS